MDEVFVYWDNSNIFPEMQRLAEERDEGPDARYRVRIHFDNLLRLAHADRPLRKAFAAGSIPPEMRGLWNRMEARGVEVALFDRGQGYLEGAGFHRTLERMHRRRWRVEILSWRHSCNQRMRGWAEENGVFVALDDFYESITFLEPSKPGYQLAMARRQAPLDLAQRPTV